MIRIASGRDRHAEGSRDAQPGSFIHLEVRP